MKHLVPMGKWWIKCDVCKKVVNSNGSALMNPKWNEPVKLVCKLCKPACLDANWVEIE